MSIFSAISEEVRIVEAVLFASAEPVSEKELAERLPEDANLQEILAELTKLYENRGVNLLKVAGKWVFRTAPDLSFLLHKEAVEQKKLSRAVLETLAIVAYHQPVTRAEIEEVRGVSISKGTLDILLSIGWIRMRGRKRTPGRPLTYGTTESFLDHFTLESVGDLPGFSELKGTGLLEGTMPAGFKIPVPSDDPNLREDEDPLDDNELFSDIDLLNDQADKQDS